MELKKSPKANLEKLKLIFREVGLALVLIIAILAFEWGAPKLSLEQIPPRWEVIDVDYIPITQPDKPQIARIEHKLPVFSDIIVPVESGTLDVKPFDELFVDPIDNVPERDYIFIPPMPEDEPLPPEVIEVPPTFQGGGVEGFRKWVSKNIEYPDLATINGIEGKVIVQFIVDQHGGVTDVVILKGIDPTLDKEAIRVIKSSPRWSPGIQNGKIVRARYIIPVTFILQ